MSQPKRRRYRNLADYLRRSGERQVDLAARIGVSQATISRASTGGYCSLFTAKRISAATGVPLNTFGPPLAEEAVA